jgi:Holliday junction resolvase RusA-like endonuclease
VYEGRYVGKLARVNEWHASRRIGSKSTIYETTAFKTKKRSAAAAFMLTRPETPIDYPVDARIRVSMWKVKDTDAPIKGLLDALEYAGVVANDRLIRDIRVIRYYHHRDADDQVEVKLLQTSEKRGATMSRSVETSFSDAMFDALKRTAAAKGNVDAAGSKQFIIREAVKLYLNQRGFTKAELEQSDSDFAGSDHE